MYLLPIIAVLAGFLFFMLFRPHEKGKLKLLLAFSGAFLLAITVFEIIPSVFAEGYNRFLGLFILLGMLLQIILEFFSKGAEHGHMHFHNTKSLPLALFISLCIHAFLEGLPIRHDNHLMYGILIHKLPVAFILTAFLHHAEIPKWRIIVTLLIFAAMTPLGTLVSNNTDLLTQIEPYVNALVVGTFLHISTVILFEGSEGHKFNLSKLLVIILAITIAYFM